MRLPDGLLTIHFGSFFNCSLSRVRFPDGLATLIFGLFYSKTLEDVWLPASLKTLRFGRDFNQPMDWVYFPEKLTALTFGRDFNQSLDKALGFQISSTFALSESLKNHSLVNVRINLGIYKKVTLGGHKKSEFG